METAEIYTSYTKEKGILNFRMPVMCNRDSPGEVISAAKPVYRCF